RFAQMLRDSAEQLLQARRLVTIVTDAPVTLDLEHARTNAYDPTRLDALLRELEFRIPPNEMPPRRFASAESAQMALLIAPETALEAVSRPIATLPIAAP